MVQQIKELPAVPSDASKLISPEYPGVVAGMLGLWNWRNLISIMVQRDLLGRYKGSLMGAFWPVINPLGHLILYTFVFNVILKVSFSKNGSTADFAINLMTGLLSWGAFSEAVSRSTTIILEVPNLVKRVVFPVEILPLTLVLSSVLSQAIAAGLLVVVEVFSTGKLSWHMVFLLPVLVSQMFFTAGVCWFLASLGVYIRDLKHVMALALSAWMFATPIVYPVSKFPANLQFLLWMNPLAGIVSDYRRIIVERQCPDWHFFLAYTAIGIVSCLIGFAFFYKTKRSFADIM